MATMNLEIDLRWIRKQKGQLGKDVAEELCISVTTLYAWETGRSKPNKTNREAILRWILGKTEQELSTEKAIKKWLRSKDQVEEVVVVEPEEWDKGKALPSSDVFLVSLERPSGVSKAEMVDYIAQAVKGDCGCLSPDEPLFYFHEKRSSVRVTARR